MCSDLDRRRRRGARVRAARRSRNAPGRLPRRCDRRASGIGSTMRRGRRSARRAVGPVRRCVEATTRMRDSPALRSTRSSRSMISWRVVVRQSRRRSCRGRRSATTVPGAGGCSMSRGHGIPRALGRRPECARSPAVPVPRPRPAPSTCPRPARRTTAVRGPRCRTPTGRWRCRSGSSARPSSSTPCDSYPEHAARRAGYARARAGSHGRRGGGPSTVRDDRLDVGGVRKRDPHPPRRAVAASAQECEPASARIAGKRGRLVGADDGAAVGGVGDAQADAQRAVREQAVADDARSPLRAEHEMDAERSAPRSDVGEHRVQLGVVAEQAANSSTTTTSRGRSTRGSRMSRAPAPAIAASRQRTSARRLSIARRAPAPSRSVRTPVTCGTAASASNAVPPLKSASRKLTSLVEWVAHSARIHVMSSSLLPDPVTPATTACGPSATRSTIAGSAAFDDRSTRGERPGAGPRGPSARSSASAIGSSGRAERPEAALGARAELVGDADRLLVRETLDIDVEHLAGASRSRAPSSEPPRRRPRTAADAGLRPARVRSRCRHPAAPSHPAPTRARRSPDPARRCGRRSAHARSSDSGPTMRSLPGGIARHSCTTRARCTAAAAMAGPMSATPSAAARRRVPRSTAHARARSGDGIRIALAAGDAHGARRLAGADHQRLASSRDAAPDLIVAGGEALRHPDGAPSVAGAPRRVADATSRDTRSRAAAASTPARRRSRRAPRPASSTVAIAISGPSAANSSANTEPVTRQSTTAPIRGTVEATIGSGGRGGRRPRGRKSQSIGLTGIIRIVGEPVRVDDSWAKWGALVHWTCVGHSCRRERADLWSGGRQASTVEDSTSSTTIGDVVAAAVLERGLEHRRHGRRRVGVLVEEMPDAVIRELFGETVRADHEPVAGDRHPAARSRA